MMAKNIRKRAPRRLYRFLFLLLVGATAAVIARYWRTTGVDYGDRWPEPQRTPAPERAAPRPSPRPRGAVPVAALPASAAPLPDGSAPAAEYTIKGKHASRLFHPPASPYYARTRADVWFRTTEDARAAGFTEWSAKRRAAS
ncbi:sunset domain-containing protein [Pseudonocardia nigra]|uniref:sunset domain-containing protein n=1 Tax=Pseudonocardia nigra TaxID=1921578 RepID=UPI001C5F820B|nr:hypothetical protein [Pseudonocardia nigra]